MFDSHEIRTRLKPLDLKSEPKPTAEQKKYFHYYRLALVESYPGVVHHFGSFFIEDYDIVAHAFLHPNPVGTCFILHGYFDHSGLYEHLIEYCLQHRKSVFIYDLPGHGLSSGDQASIEDFSEYAESLVTAMAQFGPDLPKPWTIMAQSTGAAIVMEYLLGKNRPAKSPFEKIILLAPLVRPVQWARSRFLYGLYKWFIDSVARSFSINSDSASFVKFVHTKDPLQSTRVPIRWIGALNRWIKRFEEYPPSEVAPLIIQGDADTTVDWQRNLPDIQQKFPNARIVMIEGAKHHLVNEAGELREQILSAVEFAAPNSAV